ncbi:HD domain-containing protein [Candidatus Woesebacteria bacterium]|nr:HD domain-containing protein [Candidatus Woesebacteria bacterium]
MEKQIVQFLQEVEKLKSTLRHNWTKTGRQESVAEHTWRIAMLFLMVYEAYGLKVDPLKCLKMILIHDIPEMYHGDIPAWMKDVNEEKHSKHKMREAKASQKMFKTLPKRLQKHFDNINSEYENYESDEAKLAHALDKIESQLQHLDSGPKYWSEEEKGHHMLHYPDVALKKLNNPNIQKIWDVIYRDVEKIT